MIRVVFRLLVALFRLLLFPILALTRRRASGKHGFLSVAVDGQLADVAAPRRFFAFPARKVVSLHALATLAGEVEKDARVKGLVVHLRHVRSGMAGAQALHALLARVRKAGKEVVVYLPNGADARSTFVAMAGSRVLVGPQASVAPIGFAVQSQYVRGALDRAGVVPEVLAHGKYKAAGEQIARSSMSEPQREQLDALVGQMHDALAQAIADGRRVSDEKARALIDGAPYLADEAAQLGLVDAASYEDELPEPARFGRAVPAARYVAARRATRLGPILPPACIGVVRVHGAITQGQGTFGGLAAEQAVVRTVRAARKNGRVRGVILHIDSPGGSALASDKMHHELVLLAREKPLVACMANVAASGGYYVAAAAHAVVAHPLTVTGSIGVIAARVALAPLLEKLGVVTEVVKRGAHAELLATPRVLTDDERATLMREIDGVYRAFVRVVAEGRKKSVDEVESLAQGRVWTGRDAQAAGLVDELGGFDRALAMTRSRVGAGADRLEPVVLVPPRKPVPPFDAKVAPAAQWFDGLVRQVAPVAGPLALAALFTDPRERVFAWCPIAAATLA